MLFYECKISYVRRNDDEMLNKATEVYLIEGINPTDCEQRLIDKIKPQLYGEYEVQQMKKVQYYDMFIGKEETYYKGQLEIVDTNDFGDEIRKKANILLTENSLMEALKKMKGNMEYLNCELVGIAKSPIIEVLRATNEPENENN